MKCKAGGEGEGGYVLYGCHLSRAGKGEGEGETETETHTQTHTHTHSLYGLHGCQHKVPVSREEYVSRSAEKGDRGREREGRV